MEKGQTTSDAPSLMGEWIILQTNGLGSKTVASSIVAVHQKDSKRVKVKPRVVSLGRVPAFCALIREGKGSGDYIVDYRQGRMTRGAVLILEALNDRGAMVTPDLRRAVAMHGAERTAEFDRAMAELQRGLWIVKVEEVYDPDFYYRWDLLDNWLPGPLVAARDLGRAEAARRLLAAYLKSAAAAQTRFLAGLFGLGAQEVGVALDSLEAAGAIRLDQKIRGLPGSWVVWQLRDDRQR